MGALVVHSAIQAFVLLIVWMTICQPYQEESDDFCTPERAPSRAIFHLIPVQKKGLSRGRSDVVVRMKSDGAAAHLDNKEH